eukprot:64769-Pyramimonas_sp.AAC.1
MRLPPQGSASRPHKEFHLRPQWKYSYAFPPHNTAFRGPTGSSTYGPSGGVHMCVPHPGQRFVAPQGAPSTAPMAVF